MASSPHLFSPLKLGPIALPNRIMISPMCQYSAIDGCPVDWHLIHLGSLAISGAGLLCVEATSVTPEGRITPACLGLYSDKHQAALQRIVNAVRSVSAIPLALQLSHAGRKASSHVPWEGGALIAPEAGGWTPAAPSAVAHRPEEPAPRAMTKEDIRRVIDSFAQAAARARRLGFDAIELHMAHGYLVHQFLSPLSNRRDDAYGGSLRNRMRLALEVFQAVAEAAGPQLPVGVRLSATDWDDGGWDLAQTIEISRQLERLGCAFLDVSSGGLSYQQKIPLGRGYQVSFAAQVRREVRIPVIAVGLITQPAHAEQIIAEGSADMVAIARAFLHDPRWTWRAASELGATVDVPKPLLRALPQGHAPIFEKVQMGQR